VISQSYNEGSSWIAFKVVDKLWVGGADVAASPLAANYSIDFEFGCQTYVTGLFRSQFEDGIMGLSPSKYSLPYLLWARGVTASRMFALCFRQGGGILTLGGVDQRLHGSRAQGMSFAALRGSSSFEVTLLDLVLKSPQDTKGQVRTC